MPWKVSGRNVLVQKSDGSWHVLKSHESTEKAERHLRALYANVAVGHKLSKKK